MTEKEKKYLSDISTSATWIQDFVRDTTSFSEYCRDQKTKSAVERHLGIIGEAVNKYLKESDSNELSYASQIISLRNRLIHSYDGIDDSIIWAVITRHLEPLKWEVDKKLNDPTT